MKNSKSSTVARISRNPKKRAARKYAFPVIIEKDDGGFFAVCPSLQGCYTQGDTIEEVMRNIEDAVQLHVESRIEHGEEVPQYDIFRLATIQVTI